MKRSSCCCVSPSISSMEVELNLCEHNHDDKGLNIDEIIQGQDNKMNSSECIDEKQMNDDDECNEQTQNKSALLIKANLPKMSPINLPSNRIVLHRGQNTLVFHCNEQTVYKVYDLDNTEWIREISVLTYVMGYQHSSFICANEFSIDCVYFRTNDEGYLVPRLCCVMELPYYDHRLLDEIGMVSDMHLLQVFVDILEGVTFMHDRDMMHRDLKLANVMMDRNGRAKIIDFSHSLRRRVKSLVLDQYVATFDHRAPEVFTYIPGKTKPYTEAIDVWAVGMMMFQVVTKLIFSMNICKTEEAALVMFTNTEESYMAVLNDLYQISTKNTKLKYADVYLKWITKMLKKDASQRITAKAMLTEIIGFCEIKNIDIQLATYHGMDQVFETNDVCDCVASHEQTEHCDEQKQPQQPINNEPVICEPISEMSLEEKHSVDDEKFKSDSQLEQSCVDYSSDIIGLLKVIKTVTCMQYDPEMLCDMVIYLWDNGLRDMYELCLATAILVESLIYDNVQRGIEQYVMFINESRCIDHCFDMHLVKRYIWAIVERHEEQLFLADTFIFEKE